MQKSGRWVAEFPRDGATLLPLGRGYHGVGQLSPLSGSQVAGPGG